MLQTDKTPRTARAQGPNTVSGVQGETPFVMGLRRKRLSMFSKIPPVQSLQRAIYADYRPRTNFELELVARLVSLLWRLRRAVAIESGLLNIQAEILQERRHPKAPARKALDVFYTVIPSLSPADQSNTDQQRESPNETAHSGIARSFLRLASIDSGVFDRLGRYEMSLWRQTVQIVLLLNSVSRGANEYADTENKYLQLRHLAGRRRRAVWPPFETSR